MAKVNRIQRIDYQTKTLGTSVMHVPGSNR